MQGWRRAQENPPSTSGQQPNPPKKMKKEEDMSKLRECRVVLKRLTEEDIALHSTPKTDNLVSGRRSRVRSSKEEADELDTPRQGLRKSVRKAAETPMADEDVVDEEEPAIAIPSRKRSASIDQSSTPKRSRTRQAVRRH